MDPADRIPPRETLNSWKEIADHFGRSERTVRRWEESEGLPVHRHAHEKRGSVYAFRAELDAWRGSRSTSAEPLQSAPAASPVVQTSPKHFPWLLVAAGAFFVAASTWSGASAWRTNAASPGPGLHGRHKPSQEALDSYSQGLWLLRQGGGVNLEKSAARLREAITADPQFALAHARLAEVFAEEESIGVKPARVVMPQAREAAARAVDLDDTLPEGHLVLGMVKVKYDWDWKEGCRAISRAIDLNKDDSHSHVIKATHCLIPRGLFTEAETELRLAQLLDPAARAVGSAELSLALARRDFETLLSRTLRVLDLTPDAKWPYPLLANLYARKGMFPEARKMLNRAEESKDGAVRTLSVLAQVYSATGERAKAIKIVEQLKEAARTSYVSPTDLAAVYASLADADSAFELLNHAFEERCSCLLSLKTNISWDPLRRDARFAQLLRSIHLD